METWEERLGTAIEHAAECLPAGCMLNITIERGGYGLSLSIANDEHFFDGSLIDEIEQAVAFAINKFK